MNEESTAKKGLRGVPAALRSGLGKIFGPVGRWVGRHKKTAVALVLLAVAGGLFSWRFLAAGQSAGGGAAPSFIRTTTLQKTSLENSISATGTVGSAEVSNVTTQLKYTVKEVNVQVGDTVQEGDVICTLDPSEIEKQIQKAKEALTENTEKAQASYDRALNSYNSAYDKASAAETTYNNAAAAYNSASSAFENAKAAVAALQSAYDAAAASAQAAAADVAAKLDAYTAAVTAAGGDLSATAVTDAARALNDACSAYNGTSFTAGGTVDTASQGGGLAAAAAAALQALNSGKELCNYTALEQALNAAASAKEQARTQLDTLESQVTSAKEQLSTAESTLKDSKTSDTLEDLQDQLEECTLKAASSGTVTALNATVGSAVSDSTVATIQDTGKLKISFSVEEYDISNVKVGLPVNITSDATGDTVIHGTVTQVSKTASSGQSGSGGFACEATVDDRDTGLLIGMNAKLSIILSTTDNVFVVPIDAVGTDENGGSVVYVKTGGSGVQAAFEAVPVTTGEENDYYIEISGDGLEEGMEVRSSANAEEAEVGGGSSGADGAAGGMGGFAVMGGAMAMPDGGGAPGGGGGGPMGG